MVLLSFSKTKLHLITNFFPAVKHIVYCSVYVIALSNHKISGNKAGFYRKKNCVFI